MNVLFLTLLDFSSLNERNIYTDLLREFYKKGHSVYVISPVERRKKQSTILLKTEKATILKLKIGNTQKTNIFEKGISTISIEPQFIAGIKKYFSDVKFGLVMYSTPPITFCNAIEYVKKRDGAKTYLLLKDIFPQNAIDIGILTTSGLRGFIYKYFRGKEKKLYALSDRIGCMSPANVDYVLNHNPEVDHQKVEICPNSTEIENKIIPQEKKNEVRCSYEIPVDKKIFIYGGNLGKPQDIPFIIECIKACSDIEQAFFLIIGDGTEYELINKFYIEEHPPNMKLMQRLPKDEFDSMVAACDIGMIFLDHRFTIPNFPSRLLSYMQAGLPVIAATDKNTDVGKTITEGGFGWWCESTDSHKFRDTVLEALATDMRDKQANEWEYLCSYYASDIGYDIISKHIQT